MKFRVTMKDPDTLHDAVDEAALESVKGITGLSLAERAACRDLRAQEFQKLASKWFEYGEYLVVEIDTEAQTCVVVPRGG